MTSEQLLATLFVSLSCFVIINFILSLVLWRYSKHIIYKMIVKYWTATIVFFAFQFFFPNTPAQISFSYAAGILPMISVYIVVSKLFDKKANIFLYASFHFIALTLTLILWQMDKGFTAMTLPLSISMSLPLLSSMKTIFFTHRKQATLLQKLLGVLLFFWIPHCFSFALFRMQEETQIFGWITSYTLYDMMAILLPAIAIEESFRNETVRLEQQVKSRTMELREALKDKETLLKILVHDISNPLTVMRWYLSSIRKNPTQDSLTYLDKIAHSQEIVENIVKKVRQLQANPSDEKKDYPRISFRSCLDEMKFVFEKPLLAKNLKLEIIDEFKGEDFIKADQFSLTHSVLSNFVNNAIKFSFPDSTIRITIGRENDHLTVSIQDFGVGMGLKTIKDITSEKRITSSPGTLGEDGSGLGMSIATTVLKNFGAKLEIESQEYSPNSQKHGTTIKLSFPLASN